MRYTDRKRPWSDNDSKARRYYARRPGTNDAQKQWICLPPSLVIKGLYIQRKSRCDLNELSTVPKLMATVLSPSTQILTARRHQLQCARRRSSAKLEPTARSPSATKASSHQTVGHSVPPLCQRCSMAMVDRSHLALQSYQSLKDQQALDNSPSQLGTSIGHYWGLLTLAIAITRAPRVHRVCAVMRICRLDTWPTLIVAITHMTRWDGIARPLTAMGVCAFG